MPKYTEVNWEDAECRQLEVHTDLFYDIEEQRSVDAYDHINAVRSICVSCPIWKDCLAYAFQNENYGMWGGMTSIERISITQPTKYPNQLSRALKSFDEDFLGLVCDNE